MFPPHDCQLTADSHFQTRVIQLLAPGISLTICAIQNTVIEHIRLKTPPIIEVISGTVMVRQQLEVIRGSHRIYQ